MFIPIWLLVPLVVLLFGLFLNAAQQSEREMLNLESEQEEDFDSEADYA